MVQIISMALLLACAEPMASAADAEKEVSSGILVRAISAIHPVLSADEQVHLVYELEVVNHSSLLISVDRVEALSGAGGRLVELDGDALAMRIVVSGGETGKVFAPSHSGYIYMDISVPRASTLPTTIRHRISTTSQRPAKPGDEHHATTDPSATVKEPAGTFLGAEVTVDPSPAIAIAPPLRGQNWLVANGCCDELNGHRITVFAINGALSAPEKFAIDFVQLDREHRLLSGPIDRLSSYAYYGVPIYSVADGTVVSVEDGAPEQTPGALPTGMTPATAAGNHIIVNLGNRRFAMYAHLQPGSIPVKAGDRVRRGDVFGKVGNSGNTTNPHLHFHITDRPSVLAGDGLPFVIEDFKSAGAVTELGALFEGKPGNLDIKRAGRHLRRLPLNNSVVSFE